MYRITRPGEIAIHIQDRDQALRQAAALSMRAVNEQYHLDPVKQQTAYVWDKNRVKIAHYVNGKQLS
jgi:hypothetical protein